MQWGSRTVFEVDYVDLGFLDPGKRLCFLCIGNPLVERDVFGVLFADELSKLRLPETWLVLRCETVPENFIGKVIKFEPDVVVFVDTYDDGQNGSSLFISPMESVRDKSFGTHKTSLHQLNEFIQNFRPTVSWFLGQGAHDGSEDRYKVQISAIIEHLCMIFDQNML